ncbi:hypothetical protein AIOL_004321 [Candidatus Rhodobacter oscarellae]|uniref:Uncharacterized protein n=1 Tax=Candidatus Rhodobacter oscarellae TaxID=1675527 RepID=A0A0J9ECA9_9RHOB|nr:dimethylsulfonioproprionate lyase family protein [Candidatus Rhodobacter lobularis]KMW59339.1 hypothetical protein AIOL_004321 [Candidatus Rhodobacter lobularis]
MTRAVWDNLLAEARTAHQGALAAFCPFPDDLKPRDPRPYRIRPAALFEVEALTDPLARAYQEASPVAQWRETWKGSDIDATFLDRFGCYCLIGGGGAFMSKSMAAYLVYMPPGLHYPWHQHPAEEIYFVLAGSATFRRAGAAPQVLGPGQHVVHASNQPHATTTLDQPLLAHVLWKGDLTVKPTWARGAL